MKLNAAGVCLGILLLGLTNTAVSASRGGFRIDAISTADSRYDDLSDVKAGGIAFVSRSRGWNESQPPITLSGHAASASVERYEQRWTRVSKPTHFEPGTFRDFHMPERSTIAEPTFELTGLADWGAVALAAEESTVPSWSHLRVQAPMTNPCLASLLPSDGVGYNNPNERGAWCVPGSFLVATPATFAATIHGNVTLYWFDATVQVDSERGREELVSYARPETGRSTDVVDVLHAVWYVVHLRDAEMKVASAGPSANLATAFWARQLSAAVQEASFAAPSNVSGTLPNSTRHDTASLWIAGNMTLGLNALQTKDQAGRPSYEIQLVGPPDAVQAYSFAGGPVEYVRGGPALAGPVAVGVVIVLVVAWGLYAKLRKETLLDHSARDTIARLIKDRPGLSLQDLKGLMAQTLRGHGIILHHLEQLERFGLVVSCKAGRYRRYFTTGDWNRVTAAKRALLEDVTLERIAKAVAAHPGSTREQLFRALGGPGRSRSGLSYHLGRLVKSGLVRRERAGRSGHFHPTPELVAGLESMRRGNT